MKPPPKPIASTIAMWSGSRWCASALAGMVAGGLTGEDRLPGGASGSRPGSPCPDAPVEAGFLLDRVGGAFVLLAIDADAPESVSASGVTARRVRLRAAEDASGALGDRYLGTAPGAVYLVRPDQHVVARWERFDAAAVRVALTQAVGHAT